MKKMSLKMRIDYNVLKFVESYVIRSKKITEQILVNCCRIIVGIIIWCTVQSFICEDFSF